jgi:hypothetical protein
MPHYPHSFDDPLLDASRRRPRPGATSDGWRHADDQAAHPALARRRQFCRDELDMPVRHERAGRAGLTETVRRKAREVVAQQRRTPRPSRRTTATRPTGWIGSSGGRNLGGLGRDLAAQARDKLVDDLPVGCRQFGGLARRCTTFCSTSFIMSNSILLARKSSLADLLTILRDDRLTLGDLAPLAVDRNVNGLLQRRDQQRRQVLAARVAGLALLEWPAARRLAIAIL